MRPSPRSAQPHTFVVSVLLCAFLTAAIPAFADWKEKVLHNFQINGKDGYDPVGGLVFDKQGRLYGTTAWGGGTICGCGTVFQLMPVGDGKWTERVLHSFSGDPDGDYPGAPVVLDAAGNLYGTTVYGGAYGDGTVFQLTADTEGHWSEKVLHSFRGSDGAWPGSLTFGTDGNLYGTTSTGGIGCDGDGCGTVFELTRGPDGKWQEKVLHKFSGRDGAWPNGALVFDAAGNLYGTTYGNRFLGCSPYDCGTVFRLTPGADGRWKQEVLHRFHDNGKDGYFPSGGVISDASGRLYGTTEAGGSSACFGSGCGTVFRLSHCAKGKWSETLLHVFSDKDGGGTDPLSPLVFGRAGELYGATYSGGSHSYGTVFRLSRCRSGKWAKTVLYNFCSVSGCRDGTHPLGGLILDDAGNLYNTTFGGLSNSGPDYPRGNVFELLP